LTNILGYKDYCKERILSLMQRIEINDSLYREKIIEKNNQIAYDSTAMYSQRQTIHELTPLIQENKNLKQGNKVWGLTTILSIGTLILSIIFK